MGAWNGGSAKRCSCGVAHDEASWSRLGMVGELDDGEERIEIRNCPCGSSIAILLGPSLACAPTEPAPAMAVAS